MAGLHITRTHKKRGVGSRRFVAQNVGGTSARVVGTSRSGERQLSQEHEDAAVYVKSSLIG